MVIINKNILKKLMAIADATYFPNVYQDAINQLKNENDFDKDMLSDFLKDTEELTNKILEEGEELDDWSDIEQEKREWLED